MRRWFKRRRPHRSGSPVGSTAATWGDTASSVSANVRDQVSQFTEWANGEPHGSVTLHPGERILSAADNAELIAAVKKMGGGS